MCDMMEQLGGMRSTSEIELKVIHGDKDLHAATGLHTHCLFELVAVLQATAYEFLLCS